MRLLTLVLVCSSCLSLAEEDSSLSLVDLSNSPIPRVAGSVNLVSGNLVDQTVHQETSGIDPYALASSYNSGLSTEGSLAYAWNYYHASTLEVHEHAWPESISYPSPIYLPQGNPCQAFEHYPSMRLGDSRPKLLPKSKPPKRIDVIVHDAGGATYALKNDEDSKKFAPQLEKTGYALVGSIRSPFKLVRYAPD